MVSVLVAKEMMSNEEVLEEAKAVRGELGGETSEMSEMNERVDEPQAPADRPPLKEVSSENLQRILEAHRKWVGSDGETGQRADLSHANLEGANLQSASLVKADLRGARLFDANLKRAILSLADLQGANLIKANLQGSALDRTNLQSTEFGGADLQGVNLFGANLQGAALGGANLQGAELGGANLQEAIVSEANLQEAHVGAANLQRANLHEANLRGTNLTKANLKNAFFADASLRDVNLQDANLTDATGLLSGQLGGANVSGARLPPDIHDFKALTTVEEASKNTRRIFLAMLLGCAYSVLTIFSTTDARLLTNSASSPLPIIRTPIPIAGFFGVAPAILLAIYLYFHFYLQRLWERLAKLPAVFPDGSALDEKAYPWLLNALVRSHFALLRRDRPHMSLLQTGVSILLAWWAVPFTIALFWLRSLQRHDWLLTGFLMGFLVLAVVWAVWFQRLAKITLRGHRWTPIRFKFVVIGAVMLIFVLGVSFGAIRGTPSDVIPKALRYFGARAFADLTEEDVSIKPPNWFLVNKELTQIVNGARLKGADLQYAVAIGAFLVKADLRGADLVGANLRGALLQGADLREAILHEANLREARLEGANLRGAFLDGAQLEKAWLDGADLYGAKLHRARLRLARLQGADLRTASFSFTSLYGARLDGANLRNARVKLTILSEARLDGADLRRASFEGSHLDGAQLERADLQGADLGGAKDLKIGQVKAAKNWQLAFYNDDFLKKLGLSPDHNETVKKKLAEMEKEKKATGAKPWTGGGQGGADGNGREAGAVGGSVE